ncbi:MAG: squalene/phytoene synthase family protein [Verrucomicrobia bacterium]|nr:squalene/phytoene synthase family protein [Verrucomicrobiota bacterium]
MNPPPSSAEAITRSSKSNFALAFLALPPERRRDLTTFYAFCRVIDDLADQPGRSPEEKKGQLSEWKRALSESFDGEPPLAAEVRALRAKYGIGAELLAELIQGCEMDLVPARYQTSEDLLRYCYRVASVVGLASIEIFGYQNPATKEYAIELGYALQWTNIVRDVATDFANGGRIYLPLEDFARFGITPEDLALRKGGPRFGELMAFEAERAESFYARALAKLPPEDRHSLAPAEIMRRIYHRLLKKMRRDGFRVFEKEYRLGKLEKLAMAARVLLGC